MQSIEHKQFNPFVSRGTYMYQRSLKNRDILYFKEGGNKRSKLILDAHDLNVYSDKD